MFQEEYSMLSKAAENKSKFLKNNPAGYWVAAMLAGIYVGFGILLIFSAGGMISDQPYVKIIMGASFGIALSLVVMAGAELFTGNNLIMAGGVFSGTATVAEAGKLWVVCLLGNWAGSILLALIFWGAGLTKGPVGEFMANAAAAKMAIPLIPLFLRAVLCNILVCLAIWCGFRCKSESGKLIMVFWCLFAFITSGYEHSIANMTLLTVGILSPGNAAVSLSGYFYNILVVTFGNMAGGILFTAVPYYLISRKKEA
ncbi:formate/nitrite transporter family protein [Clostridium boliviensis]|uniref:Formate/nitrite transporter family protein n=1 Tax=Clostridium boliviensis TaxID=318465 RepID=A0ABU4GQQ3_9CLOT|nr:formate/nitrite transporter family protein [Clostridium boliviensis]MDW2799968.1 formate/nitrite transporter family protein [Clostridium boliviensis]